MADMTVTPLTPERRRQLTRDTLIAAAADLFARRGFHAASLDEIAAAAGFTKGAIYSNFGSKEDLLLAVVEHRGDQMLSAMWDAHQANSAAHVQNPGHAAATWRRIVAADEQTQLLRLELRLYALREPSVRERFADLQRRQLTRATEFLIREAEVDGYGFRMPVQHLAGLMIALTEGLLMEAAVDPDNRTDYEQRFEEFLALLVAAGVNEPDA
jgi:AcrR family transcriptional regulator